MRRGRNQLEDWETPPLFQAPLPTEDDSDVVLLAPSQDALEVEFSLPKKKQRLYSTGLQRKKGHVKSQGHRIEDMDLVNTFDNDDIDLQQLPLQALGLGVPADLSSEPIPDSLDEGYLTFLEGVEAGTCGFYQLTPEVFVVQGWDVRLPPTATDKWYHLSRLRVGTGTVHTCFCPTARSTKCIHQRYLEEYGVTRFPEQDLQGQSLGGIVPFSLQCIDEETDEYLYLFSVALPRRNDLKSRTIVSFQTTSPGIWKCQSDQRSHNCLHIDHIQRDPAVIQLLLAATTEPEPDGEKILKDLPTIASRPPQSASIFKCISHREIRPPRWASLPTDRFLYNLPEQCPIPESISLDGYSRCPCHGSVEYYDSTRPVIQRTCTIYATTRSYTATIDLQACPRGLGRSFIGPDCRDHLLFNYNNTILFTHALLNAYTSSFTTSETPFAAWVTTTSQQYIEEGITPKFVTPDVFRSAWFSFVDLQVWEGDMACPKCGPTPNETIWDGVTLAFHQKHLLPTIRPPTSLSSNAPSRSRRYVPVQQFISKPAVRKLVKNFIFSSHLSTLGTLMITDAKDIPHREAVAELIRDIPNIITELGKLDASLELLFDRVFGIEGFSKGLIPSKAYIHFMQQICAEESALQLMNRQSLQNLKLFLSSPSVTTQSALITCPVIYLLLREHEKHPQDLIGVLTWMASRVDAVLLELMTISGRSSTGPPTDASSSVVDLWETLDWRKACTFKA